MSLSDIVRDIVLMIFDAERISDIGFFEWFFTFVTIYVLIRAYIYLIDSE